MGTGETPFHAEMSPQELDDWLREVMHDLPIGSRESIATHMRRFIVCEALLCLLADVPAYGWSAWLELERSISGAKDRAQKRQLREEQVRIRAERERIGAPIREFVRRHRTCWQSSSRSTTWMRIWIKRRPHDT
jgi:hypothetical protein